MRPFDKPALSVEQQLELLKQRGLQVANNDRAMRFLARLDRHLPTLADQAARRAFLDRQLEGWQQRYARFIATDGESEPVIIPADPPQAADFLLTITGLMARRSALDQQMRAHA